MWKGTAVSVSLLPTTNYTEGKLTKAYKEASQLRKPLPMFLKIETNRRLYTDI
jgi:hypothetical protein